MAEEPLDELDARLGADWELGNPLLFFFEEPARLAKFLADPDLFTPSFSSFTTVTDVTDECRLGEDDLEFEVDFEERDLVRDFPEAEGDVLEPGRFSFFTFDEAGRFRLLLDGGGKPPLLTVMSVEDPAVAADI